MKTILSFATLSLAALCLVSLCGPSALAEDNPFCEGKHVADGSGLFTTPSQITFNILDDGFMQGHELQILVSGRVVRTAHFPAYVTRKRLETDVLPQINAIVLRWAQDGNNKVEVATEGCFGNESLFRVISEHASLDKAAVRDARSDSEAWLKSTGATGSEIGTERRPRGAGQLAVD